MNTNTDERKDNLTLDERRLCSAASSMQWNAKWDATQQCKADIKAAYDRLASFMKLATEAGLDLGSTPVYNMIVYMHENDLQRREATLKRVESMDSSEFVSLMSL